MDFLFCGTSGNASGGENENAQTEQDIMERYAQFIASRQTSEPTQQSTPQSASEQAPEIITPVEGSFRDLKEFTRQLWDSVFSPADETESTTTPAVDSDVDLRMQIYSLRKENTELKNRLSELEENIKKIIG